MPIIFENSNIRVQSMPGRWIYLTWQNQTPKNFLSFVRTAKKVQRLAATFGDRGLVLDTAKENLKVQEMLKREGFEPYEELDGLIAFKKEVNVHVERI